MRITTYEKGGNSLNPFIKLFIFLVILGLFVMPVSALTDDFNDADITDWTVISGSWTASNVSSIDGANDYYIASPQLSTTPGGTETYTDSVTKATSNFMYIEFDIKPDSTIYNDYGATTLITNSRVYFSDNHYINFENTDTSGKRITITGFSYTPISYINAEWYHVEITFYTNNNVKVDIYHDNVLYDTQTSTYTHTNDGTIQLTNYVNDGQNYVGTYVTSKSRFDNILTSGVSQSTINGIEWDLDQYTEGETASYSWNLQNSFWQDLIYKYRIQILKDGVEIDTVKVSQTGTRFQNVDMAGTYEVKLQYSGLIFTNWQSIDSDSVNVIPKVDSYINVPQTSEQKTNFTVNYLYGTTPPTAAIFIKKLNEELEEYILYDIIYLDGGVANTDYSQNISIWSEGFYKLVLYNANIPEQNLKTDVIQITKVIIPPQTIIDISRIRSQQDTYSKSDMVLGDYAVDFTNYTDYIINLELYNYEYDSIVYSETVGDQSGVVLIPLYSTDLTVFTGLNNIRLSSYSNTGVFIDDIVHDNITINLVDSDGYGLTLSKYEVYTDEMFVIKCIVPQASSLKIINRLSLEEIDNIDVNSSTYINYKISQIGDYEIRLIGTSGYIRGNQYIKVVEGTIVDDPLIDEDEVIPDITFQDNTTSLLNSPYLIGLFIMCVFLAIGAPNGISGTIVTGSIGLGIVCYMGIFPWILLVIEVLVVAVLMAKGMINLSGD